MPRPLPHPAASLQCALPLPPRAAPQLTILVPMFRDDPAPLIGGLGACANAAATRIVVYDDGSCDGALIQSVQSALAGYPGATRLVVASANAGRATARNRLLSEAETDWVLFLDADMLPDDHRFLDRYLIEARRAPGPAVICGGFSLNRVEPGAGTQLHAALARASDCLDAQTRQGAPGRFLFSSNLLAHRGVLEAVPFDPGYSGWGWEDVDWGLSAAARFPVRHIDNTATHLGLERDERLVSRFQASGENFGRLARRFPAEAAAMPLYRAARLLRHAGPLRHALAPLCRWVSLPRALPVSCRLAGLKLLRATHYSRSI